MELEYGPLILKSQDRLRMVDLLTEVFEFEVDIDNNCLFLGPWRIKFIESSASGVSDRSVVFEFFVFSQDDLDEISSKFHFFLFRKSEFQEVKEKINFIKNDNSNVLEVIDLDQRQWQFKLKL